MEICITTLKINGTKLPQENPLPIFRSFETDKEISSDGTLMQEEMNNLGSNTGFRVLPYRMQDRYDRERRERDYEAIIMENQYLKAIFLPALGGRLYSLFDKCLQKELLFKNPVFQPANLAIRNAWFAGGIEWNIAQTGHTYITCSPVFFGKVTDKNGTQFLRMYDYERTKGLFWQIDFHLPENSHVLYAYVKIINDQPKSIPMYWWTNTAIRQEKNVRIFSGTKEVIYIKPVSLQQKNGIHQFGHTQLPELPSMPGLDATYPMNAVYTNEYFFQNSESERSPFEAAVYDDGFLFAERSTQPLRIRKMFCWGNHKGGRNWMDFLSEPGQGDYLEIQAGLCPTQLHGMQMEPNSEIAFTQAFCGGISDPEVAMQSNWDTACAYVKETVESYLQEERLIHLQKQFQKEAALPLQELLYAGSGFGYLERLRREKEKAKQIPASLYFPADTVGAQEKEWEFLLQEGYMPGTSGEFLQSWMTDANWEKYLRKAIDCHKDNVNYYIYLGVLLYENGKYEEACNFWKQSIQIQETAMAYRNLAWHEAVTNHKEQALNMMKHALAVKESGRLDVSYAQEYLTLLIEKGEYCTAWEFYRTASKEIKENQRIIITVSKAALELEEYDFLEWVFTLPFAVIREGEETLCDIWYTVEAQKEWKKSNLQIEFKQCFENVKKEKVPPVNIDFRLMM